MEESGRRACITPVIEPSPLLYSRQQKLPGALSPDNFPLSVVQSVFNDKTDLHFRNLRRQRQASEILSIGDVQFGAHSVREIEHVLH